MKNFIQYLEDTGYKPYRKFKDGSLKLTIKNQFSTSVEGALCDFWIKNEDYQNPIVWGLSEKGKPPTLICPRPQISYTKENTYLIGAFDDSMNICLQKEDPEDIYKALYNKSIVFTYK